jgi:hypothetical protein
MFYLLGQAPILYLSIIVNSKDLPSTKTLGYLSGTSVTKKSKVYILDSRVTFACGCLTRSLMFISKAKPTLVEQLKGVPFLGRHLALL